MQRVQLISIVVCLGIAASVAAGDIWINCEAGLEIFLDGEPAGVSDKAEFGKLLRGVTAGDHTIRIEKEGLALREFSVSVGFAVTQVVVGALSPNISEVLPEEKKPEGMIAITSDPSECNVKFAGQRVPKIKPIMTFPNVSIGEHKLWFESSGTVLSVLVNVQEGQTSEVRADFRNQRVTITGDASDVPEDDSDAEDESPRTETECIEYWIEVFRTDDLEEIEPYQQALKELGFPREQQKIITVEDDGGLPIHKLRVGPVTQSKKAKWAAGLIRNAGIPTVWVLPEECQTPSERPKREFRPTH